MPHENQRGVAAAEPAMSVRLTGLWGEGWGWGWSKSWGLGWGWGSGWGRAHRAVAARRAYFAREGERYAEEDRESNARPEERLGYLGDRTLRQVV